MRRYTLMEKIGEGGMGLVYRARQEGLDREVALKVLRIELSRDRERLKRFEREVAACIKLAHPNIVKILDSGELDGKHYYVMELLLDGRPLDAALKEQGPFAPARAAEVAAQVLDALDYAHARGILHRDVKPANVMLRPGGLVTLMDFGLAKDMAATTLLTAPGQSLGTPRYMAPELFELAEVGGAVDVWAVGCMLYEMLTGAPPFDGASIMEIAMRVSAGGFVPATQRRPELPATADRLIARFLEKVAGDRPESAGEAAELVRDWSRGGAVPSKPRARGRNPEARDTDVDGEGAAPVAAKPTAPMAAVPAAVLAAAPVAAKPMAAAAKPAAAPVAAKPMAAVARAADAEPPLRPGSRVRGRRRRRVKLATLMVGASVIGLVCGVLLRPSPTGRSPARAAAATVSELAIAPGVSSLAVSFESSRGEGLTVEAEVRERGAPARVRALANHVSAAGFAARLVGLPPGSRLRVRVRAPDLRVLEERDVATLSLAEGVERLVGALAELDPFDASTRLVTDVERALREKQEQEQERARMLEQARRRWEVRLREIVLRRRLEGLVEDFAPVCEAAMGNARVPIEARRRLYELAAELSELEEVAARAKIPFPKIAAKLENRAYGPIDAPSIAKPSGAGFVLDGNVPQAREAIDAGEAFTFATMGGEHLITYSDVRVSQEMFVGRFGEPYLIAPAPLPLPEPWRPAEVQVAALLDHAEPPGGVRVLAGTRPVPDRAAWTTVALLRPLGAHRHVVAQRLPPELFAARPLYLRFEIAYSTAAFAFDQKVEQQVWMKWIALMGR